MTSKFSDKEKKIDTGESSYSKGLDTEPFSPTEKKEKGIQEWPKEFLIPQPMDESYITNTLQRNPFGPNFTKTRRESWYRMRLDIYKDLIKCHAATAGMPPRLVAAIILSELCDINSNEILLDAWAAEGSLILIDSARLFKLVRGEKPTVSIGIAQIQVYTAIKDKLFPVNTEDYKGIPTDFFLAVARKLTIPYWTILAAAGEIAVTVDYMTRNLDKEWQLQFGFTYPEINFDKPIDIYDQVGLTEIENEALQVSGFLPTYEERVNAYREAKVANMVHAAYNSPKIVIDPNPPEAFAVGDNAGKIPTTDEINEMRIKKEPFLDARIMGVYAFRIALELYEMRAYE